MPSARSRKPAALRALPRVEDLEARYHALFEQSSDAIVTIRSDGTIDEANRAIEELTGYLRSELKGQPIGILCPRTGGIARRSRPLSQGLLETPGTYEDVAIQKKDGYTGYVDVTVRSSAGLTLALLRDVTEKKRMERELITKHTELRSAYVELEQKNIELQSLQNTLVQSGKLAALGELAAGIAHELNQPLQGIRGYAQELQSALAPDLKKLKEEPLVVAGLREIIQNVDKMASIIDYLRTFTRKSTENFELTDVHAAIEESLKMLSRQFAARGIVVERHYGRDLPPVFANPLQLEQVFINMATNARDAIEATGRGRGVFSIRTLKRGPVVEVQFKDDGVGMNEKTMSKAFNPFFTTKDVGQGMGLGLSLSYGIVNKLHGSIVIKSEVGKGSEFTIQIPTDFREHG